MKQYQELHITIDNSSQSLINKITRNLSCGWKRDEKSEQSLASTSGMHPFCFKLESECELWMIERDKQLVVTNILPIEKQELSILEYNVLINDFVQKFESSGIKCFLTKENIKLPDILSKDSSQKFDAFSHTANKSTGHAHPCDEERWFDFLYSMVTNGENIGTNEIVHFLCEDGWDEQTAFDLAMDMEYGYRTMEFASRGGK
jgi:hypothetical protein